MKRLLVSIILSLIIVTNVYADDMYITCYCPESCPGTITYTGTHVREGIAAVTKEHIGWKAIVYTMDGEYLGTFDCLDKIGTGKKNVIDIWKPDLESAKQVMKRTGGKVKVTWVLPKGDY